MTSLVPHILAANDGDLLVKVLFFAVVAIIWAASQAIGWLSGKKDKSLPPSRPRPQPQPQLQRRPTELPSRRPPPLQQRRQQQVPVPQRPPAIKTPRKQKPQPVPTPVAAAVPPASRVSAKAEQAMTNAYDARQKREDVSPSRGEVLPQRQVLDALLRPRNLRKAFVVTELLGPPVALRPDSPAR